MANLIILIFVFMNLIDRISTECPSGKWTGNDDLSNRVFTNPMFSTTTTRGRLQCAARCSENQCCRTITFNSVTHVCIGYSGIITVNSAYTSNAGSKCYQRDTPQDTALYSYDANTNMCFSLKTDEQSHSGAAYRCQQENAGLIKIVNLDILVAVQTVLRAYYNNGLPEVWVDGTDYTKTNSYIMGNGEAVPLGQHIWSEGNPDLPDEMCVGIWKEYKLNDYPCSDQMIYLCEFHEN